MPSRTKEAAEAANHALRHGVRAAPVAFAALQDAKKVVLLRMLPYPGTLRDQPGDLEATVDWLLHRGMLDSLLAGGL